ncbi:Signal transduction histidine kinase [Paenibacillus tianmuensis]|uniref:histidine kinase n=1 Tax=Paenibacillus tianmuensis TaxID=624147 RepID=A0A1G4R4Y6_9BACL|nr:HAMP domain-containing sensor histidine kinase [Paenibacillus tianmuensis]SCW51920.1 Signal transduction histidine kinase [Paenibacillus tianmuensis]
MKFNFIYTMRWKFLSVFALSIASAFVTAFIGYRLGFKLENVEPFTIPINWVVKRIGSLPVLVAAGFLMFLIYFFLFSRKMFDYLEEITRGLQEISQGNLSYEITTQSSDELGVLADHFNRMTKKLRKSIEEERKAERTKNELITGVSHDLRTPLTSVLGYLELIETDRYKDEVELRYYTKIAYEKTKNLKKLIDHLFEYTSLSDEGIKLHMKKVNIIGFLKQLTEEFNPQLKKAGMSCRLAARDDSIYVEADGHQLMRAYENVISNAIRYGSSGKYIDIRIGSTGGEAVVEIINYGEAIPERDLPYVFERFYRADKSRSSQNGGTGLGLAITKSIIELHGGRISVRSDRRETAFETRLPLCQVSSQEPQKGR